MRRTPALTESKILTFRRLVGLAAAQGQEFLRILRHAAHQDLKMQVWAGGAPRIAHLRHFLAAFDQVALFDKAARQMGIARQHLIAMVHFNYKTLMRLHLLRYHYAACCREYGGAHWRWKIQTLVQGAHTSKRVDAPAKQ